MRSVVDRNVVMRRMTVHHVSHYPLPLSVQLVLLSCLPSQQFNCLQNYFVCKCMTFTNVALVSNRKFLILSVAPVRFLMWSPLDNVKCVTVSQRASCPPPAVTYADVSFHLRSFCTKAVKGMFKYSLNKRSVPYNTDGKRRSVLKGTFPILSCQRTSSLHQTWLFSLNKTLCTDSQG